MRHTPAVAPLQSWVWPAQPWKRVHIDFAGPYQGSMFLVAVDAHSKWPEVHIMKETTTAKTIEILRKMFAAFGLPEQLVTDNGPQFVSEDFAAFTESNGIRHIRCAPYHPASNGLAERFVQSLKMNLKSTLNSGLSLSQRVSNYLFTNRSTPHATTGVSPYFYIVRFVPGLIYSVLIVIPEYFLNRLNRKHSMTRARYTEFFVGQSVMARNLRPGPDWVPAIIVERLGPVSYLVETSERQLWKRHIDLLKELSVKRNLSDAEESDIPPVLSEESVRLPDSPPSSELSPSEAVLPPASPPNPSGVTAQSPPPENTETPTPTEPRYPKRIRHPPDRYM